MLKPSCHTGATKRSWVSFYKEEAEEALKVFRESLKGDLKNSPKLLPGDSTQFKRDWRAAKESSGIILKPKDLRDWFCQTMGELGVSDRFIDAFCGRTPKTVLARHYSDYNPKRLQKIYSEAGQKVLTE